MDFFTFKIMLNLNIFILTISLQPGSNAFFMSQCVMGAWLIPPHGPSGGMELFSSNEEHRCISG